MRMQNGYKNEAGHMHARGRASEYDADAEVESLASQLELVPRFEKHRSEGSRGMAYGVRGPSTHQMFVASGCALTAQTLH